MRTDNIEYNVFIVRAYFIKFDFEISKEITASNEWEAVLQFDTEMNDTIEKYFDRGDYEIKSVVTVEK